MHDTARRFQMEIQIGHCQNQNRPLRDTTGQHLSRLVLAFALPILVLICDRFFAAPLRALSPTGLFIAYFSLPFFS
jgi:hypothetical protein